jgi:hypothetical protein
MRREASYRYFERGLLQYAPLNVPPHDIPTAYPSWHRTFSAVPSSIWSQSLPESSYYEKAPL